MFMWKKNNIDWCIIEFFKLSYISIGFKNPVSVRLKVSSVFALEEVPALLDFGLTHKNT